MPNIKIAKQKAWEFYNKWRQEATYSPALKCNVRISLKGWNHLAGNIDHEGYGKKRTASDAYRRLMLLPYAKGIIEKSTTIQNIITKNGRTFYGIEAMVIVKEDGKELPRKVRVVLIEDAAGNKIFYSVMDKKQRQLSLIKLSNNTRNNIKK
ncbi:MAG: hypothetical protein NT141_00825 [candidate division WWE3 bacterium]|nr:hypothetical protein [candidate division WWE3 bacterium]